MQMHETSHKPERVLRLPEVLSRTGNGRSKLYAMVRNGDFPQPIQLGPHSRGWRERDIDEWIRSRPVADLRRNADAQAA